jgi:hypothetical protein
MMWWGRYVWAVLLPFVLELDCGPVTWPVVMLISIGFFGCAVGRPRSMRAARACCRWHSFLPMAQQVALLSPTHASAPHGVRCACRLDEVAEILASPFGNDPNHIDLGPEALNLIDDLEIMFEKHDMPIGEVLTGTTNEHAFSQLGLTPVRRHRLQPY